MEFTIETRYHSSALKTMARAVRKTVRKKKSRRSHIFGWIVVVLALLLSISSASTDEGFVISSRTVITWLAVLLILVVLIWEDAINGYLASKRMLPGSEHVTATFSEEGYHSETAAGQSDWNYSAIRALAKRGDYVIFLLSESHAQIYDLRSITGGTAEQFCDFLEEKTGLNVQTV